MRINYDPDKDILQITFFKRAIEETTQIAPGFVLDYDEDGRVIGLELRRASQRVDDPYTIDHSIGQSNTDKPAPKVND